MIYHLDEINEDGIIFHMNQFFNEDAVYKDTDNGFSIAVHFGNGRDSGLLLDPYFKLYDSADPDGAEHMVRISLLRGELAKKHEGLPPFKINAKTKKILIRNLKRKSTLNKYKNLTVYDAMWKYLEDYASNNGLKVAPKLLDVEEYIKLLEKNL